MDWFLYDRIFVVKELQEWYMFKWVEVDILIK